MNLWDLIMIKVRVAFNAHKADANAHHTRYTDAEVSALIATHTAIPSAHHTKYTDADAVAAIAAADAYLKNTGDVINGDLDLNGELNIYQTRDWYAITLHGYDDESTTTFEINIDYASNVWFQLNAAGTIHFNKQLALEQGVNLYGNPIVNMESYDDATLSGTPKVIGIRLGTTPYYFKVYPTKT